jgi:hypothetical protein
MSTRAMLGAFADDADRRREFLAAVTGPSRGYPG